MQKVIRLLLASAASLAGLFLLIPVVLLALPFWAVAGMQAAARRALARSRPATVPWQDLMVYEPELGWKPKGHIEAWAEGIPPFLVRTDADGWRGPGMTIEDADVVVFGDSFAFGHGADEERFFANLPGPLTIKAIGANGYNMVQGLLWMRRYARRLRGKTVVWFVYYGNDLYENLRPNMGQYRIPFVRQVDDGSWETVSDHVSDTRWRFSRQVRYGHLLAEICTPSFLSERVFGASDYLIGQAAGLCDTLGARLVVVGIPTMEILDPALHPLLKSRAPDPKLCDPGLPDKRLGEAAEKYGASFLSLRDHLNRSDYLPEDVHWSASGHETVGYLLRKVAAGTGHGSAPVGSGADADPDLGQQGVRSVSR